MAPPSDHPTSDDHTPGDTALSDSVSLRIAAPASKLYDLVSDISQMGRLSPECTGGKWLDGATGPAAGARFKGSNKRGIARWSTTNTVVAAEPGRKFSFRTKDSGTEWSYSFADDGDGTIVTESRSEWAPRPLLAKVFSTLLLGGIKEHDDEMRAGMRATLERLRSLAEG